jgi:hypothetical protein
MAIAGPISFGVFHHRHPLLDWEARAVSLVMDHGARCIVLGEPQAPGSPPPFCTRLFARLAGVAAGALASRESCAPYGLPGQGACTAPDLAFILFFGPGPIPEGLAARARFGVWRFTHGAGVLGGVPFLQGLCAGKDVVSFALNLAASADGPDRAIIAGRFRARDRAAADLVEEVLTQAARWPVLALKHLQTTGGLPQADFSPSADHPPARPIPAALALASRRLRLFLHRWLFAYFIMETWSVGLLRMDAADLLRGAPLGAISWLSLRGPEFSPPEADRNRHPRPIVTAT